MMSFLGGFVLGGIGTLVILIFCAVIFLDDEDLP